MSVMLMEEKSILSNVGGITCPVELNLDYMVLDPSDGATLLDAAECLAETFAGTSINGVIVSEPMTKACSLAREDMIEFVLGYLANVAEQGLCYIAKDRETGRVIGVIACEDFNPDEEIPVFEGNLSPLNIILEFLVELDTRLFNTIEYKTERLATKNEYVHLFMIGVRMAKYKKFAAARLIELLIKDSCQKGYKAIFGEFTNFKSIELAINYCGFHQINDKCNNPIQSIYAEHETFKVIPADIATDCRILYRPLSPEYDI